jgi:hypothetical protein
VPINFIPNDPLAVDFVPMRTQSPRPNRKAAQAGFTLFGVTPEGIFEPGTSGFVFWQCREAALAAIEVWEGLDGPLRRWSPQAVNRRKLNLLPDAGDDLNAFYDRQSLAFFHHMTRGHTTFSGASTDVVAHEAGHALLDTLRPELFVSAVTEQGAFHEAFGDCMAILTVLSDRDTRNALLARSPDLGTPNFVEATAEDLSDGVLRALGKNHPAAAPRRALNRFQFQLPTTLPTTGRPDVLTSEIHSFGRVFSGCFYDTVRNIFKNSTKKDETDLLAAAQTAGKLLIAGARQAVSSNRFFQAVGRAMVLADDARNGGANRQAIGQAFSGHAVMLGSMSALMPKASLAGAAPRAAAKEPTLQPATLKDIRQRIGAPSKARFSVAPITFGKERLVEAVHHREVPLSQLSKELKGVIAIAPEGVVIGSAGRAAAVFSALPDPSTTTDEVLKFVETLLANDRIAFEPPKRAFAVESAVVPREPLKLPTHTVTVRGGKKVLTRIRFLCG